MDDDVDSTEGDETNETDDVIIGLVGRFGGISLYFFIHRVKHTADEPNTMAETNASVMGTNRGEFVLSAFGAL